MSYYEEGVGWIDASPHTDTYFAEEVDQIGGPEVLLALSGLTERQRFVIECRYGLRPGMDGEVVTFREIAALLNIDESTVREHEKAGLAALKRLIEPSTPSKHPL